jgi:hypothetical protein
MTLRQITLAMKIATALMIGGGFVALGAAILLPLESNSSASNLPASSNTTATSIATDLPPLESFDVVFNAQLRPQVTASLSSATTAAGLTLVGTIGDKIALVQSNDNVEARAVGERFDGAELLAVRAGEADVRTSNGIVTLRKAADAPQPQYIHGGRQP